MNLNLCRRATDEHLVRWLKTTLAPLAPFMGRGAGGEGQSRSASFFDRVDELLAYHLWFPQDRVSGNPYDAIAKLLKKPISHLIASDSFFREMVLTIHFDDQFERDAAEADRVRFDHMFASKFFAASASIANHLPNIVRKFVGCGSLISRELGCFRIAAFSPSFRHGYSPSPPAPLPQSSLAGSLDFIMRQLSHPYNLSQHRTQGLIGGEGSQREDSFRGRIQ